jgi:hypothetical protein
MASYNDDFIVKNGLVVRASSSSQYISTSTTTGAIITPAGVGIGGDVYVGKTLNVLTSASIQTLQTVDVTKILSTAVNTSTISPEGNALQVAGGIFATNINLSGIGLVKGSRILTEAEGFKGGIITDPLTINTNTNSTSTFTGALITPGGVGIGRNVHIGGDLYTTGTVFITGDAYGAKQHLLTTIQYNGNSYISAKSVQNGYTATITLTNTGVTSLVSGTGIAVSTSTGTVTIDNTGVLSVASGGGELIVDQATGNVTLTVQSTLQDVALRGNATDQTIDLNNLTVGNSTATGNALNVLGSIGARQLNVANTSYINGAIVVTSSTINQYIGGIITNTLRIQNTTSSISTQTGALVVDGGVGVGENVNIGKNLSVAGDAVIYGGLTVVGSYTTVVVNSTQTLFADAAIELGGGLNGTPLAINDGLDRGLLLSYNTGTNANAYAHSFLGRQSNTGELVFLKNLSTATDKTVPNPFNGEWGSARFGQLSLVNNTNSTSTTTGDLVVAGGIGVGQDIQATRVFDGGSRVITNVNITTSTWGGILVQSSAFTGSVLNVALTNTGVLAVQAGNAGIQTYVGTDVGNTGVVSLYNSGVTDIGPQGGIYSDIAFSYANLRPGANPNSGSVLIGNNSTLQTVTTRGNTTTNQIIVLNTTTSTTVTSTNALQVLGGISAKTLLITDKAYLNGAEVVTSATINNFSGGVISASLKINSGEISTSTGSGALVVNGGVGITNNLNLQSTLTIWSSAGNVLQVNGGSTFGGTATFNQTLYANTISAISNNLYLTTGTGTGTIYANGIDLLAYDNQVWYVSDSTAGSDTNDGRRQQSPFRTLKKALTVAQSGDVVYILAGTYYEIWPLVVPQGVTVKGAGLRSVTILPTTATNTVSCFYLNGETQVTDLTVSGFFKPGYAFRFAIGAKITTRSPYVERVSVITRGSVVTSADPYGFNAADAGHGAFLDAGVLDSTSLEPAMLWNEVTFIVPNATGFYMTNGARAELLNGFTYFADKSIYAVAGTSGYGGAGKTRLKLENVSGVFKVGETITYTSPSSVVLASGTIASTANNYIYIAGPSYGFETISDRAGKTVTTYGDAIQSNVQKKFNPTAGSFDGNGDYLEVLSDADFQFGTGDYTVEAWVYLSALGKTNRIFYKGTSNSTNLSLRVNSSNVLQGKHGTITITGVTALTTGQWYHVALSRQGSSNTVKLFLNGTLEASSSSATDSVSNTDPASIGGEAGTATDSLNGYLDDVRVSNNYRYSANFTAPTSALTSDANTILLLNMDGGNGITGFIDSAQGTQNIASSGGATATRIALADYHQFGAELRCIGSAAVFGNTGVTANGTGTDLKLIAFNISHIGAGGDISNDTSLTVQANEIIQQNNGKIYYQTVDQSGDFRVGSSFVINQRTGNVSFGNAQVNLSGLNQLTITDGTHNATILPTSISVGNLSLAGGTISSLSGDITLDPAGTLVTVNSDLQVNGAFSVQTLAVPGLTQSTSTTTGAFTLGGGAGIGGNVNIGGTFTSLITASSTSTIANNAIQAINGGLGAKTLYVEQDAWIGVNRVVTTATIGQSLGGIVPNALHITNTDPNNATTNSGALIVDGGVGIGGNLTVGGNLTLLGGGSVVTNVTATTDAYIGASTTKNGTTVTINIVNLGVQSVSGGTDISVSASTGTVTISNNSTLQTITDRGNITTNAVGIYNGSVSTATTSGNALSVAGGVGAQSLYLADKGWIAGSEIVTTATLGQAFSSSTQVTGQFNITNTASNAFVLSGGAQIGGSVTIQGSLNVAGTVTSINSTSVDIGNKLIFLSTLTGSAALSSGSGIIVGKDDNNANTDWATWTFDGGSPGNWQSGNGIIPLRDDLELGITGGYWWKTLRVKQIYYDTASSTSTVFSTSTIAGNSLMTTGGIAGKSLYLQTDGWVGGERIITTGNLSTYASTFNGGTINLPLIETDTTEASSTITGALRVAGGVGIGYSLRVGRSIYAGNNLDVINTATIQSISTATTTADGALRVSGGVGIGQNLRVNTSLDVGTYITAGGRVTAQNITVTDGQLLLNGVGPQIYALSGTLDIASSGVEITALGGDVSIYPFAKLFVDSASEFTGIVTITNSTATASSTTGALRVLGGISTQNNIVAAKNITALEKVIASSTAINTSSIAGNAIEVAAGGIGAQTLYLAQSGWINGSQIITTGTLNSFTGGNISNPLRITNLTDSTSTTTGALVVDGGVGIGKNLVVGGSTYLQGNLYVDGATFDVQSTTIQTGDKLIYVSTGATSSLLATNSGIGVGPVGSAYATWLFDNASTSWKSTVNITGDTNKSLGIALNPWGTAYVNTVYVRSNITATNTATGSLQVVGGAAVSENIYIGSSRANTLTNINNALTTIGGAYIGGSLKVVGEAWINNSPIITANSAYDVILTSLTDSGSTQTGALQVAGGLGVGKTAQFGEKIFINSLYASTVTNTDNALVVSGGGYFDSLMVNTIATIGGGIVITTATIGDYAFNGGTILKPIVINSSTQATSTITGAFQITNGGAGIGGNLFLGGYLNVAGTSTFLSTATFKTLSAGTATFTTATVTSAIANTSTAAGNAFQVTGGGSFGYLRVANAAWVNGSQVITAANINNFSGGTINNPLAINDPTQATSTATGAFRVINGGAGIGGNIWSGGSLNTIDTTGSVSGYFGANGLLTALNIGTNAINTPVDIIVNNVPVARYDSTKNMAVGGNHNPIYGVDVKSAYSPAWSANTVSNYLSLRSSYWSDTFSANTPRLAFGVTSNDTGATFENWIASSEQTAGGAQPLVFAGGAWPDSNDTTNNTVVEWARFTGTGNFQLKNNVIITSNNVSTSTIANNSLAVTGGIGARKIYLTENGWIAGSPIITAATIGLYQFNGGTITSPLYVNTNTQAVNATSGAIRTAGGISAVGNIYAGANFYGNLIATNVTATNINAAGSPLTIAGIVQVTTATTATVSGGFINGAGLWATGGIAANQNIIIGSSMSNTGTIAGNAVQAINGGVGAKTLFLEQEGWINGSPIITAATINSFSGGEVANQLYLSNATDATNTQSGALRVAGGVGIGKNLWVGADLNVLGNLYVDGTTFTLSSTNIETGNKVIYLSTSSPNAGAAVGAGIAVGNSTAPYISFLFNGISSWSSNGNIIPSTAGGYSLGDSTNLWNTVHSQSIRSYAVTDATSTQTGALQTIGGVGIGRNLFVGGTATIVSSAFNLTTSTGNALTSLGGIGGRYLTIDVAGYIGGSQVITAANIGGYAYNGGIVNNAIVVNTTTNGAATLNTGSIVTYGGVSITKDVFVGGFEQIQSSIYNTGTIANNALQVTGGIGARSLYLTTEGWINGSPIITAANINSFSGGQINASLTINDATDATSTTTGALRILNGGVGIGGTTYIGKRLVLGVDINQQATSTQTGSLQVLGGAGISGNTYVAGQGYFGGNVGIQTPTPGVALEVNGNFVVGAYNSSRVQLTNGGGSNAIYEIATTESNPRWQIGRDLLGVGTSGIAFMNGTQALSSGGAAVGAVSGLNGYLGFYTSNGTSQTLRGVISSGASGGDWGIGVAGAPLAKLDVRGKIRVQVGNDDNIILSNNVNQYTNLQITRTATGSSADIRIGAAAASSNFLPSAAQGDAVITFGQAILFGQQSAFEVARLNGSQFYISTATQSISTQSGALRVDGGVGIGQDLYVGGLFTATGTAGVGSAIASTSSKAGNALVVIGGIGAASLWLDNSAWINGYQVVTTQNVGSFTGAFNGGTITNPLFINNQTDSGSTSSGALYTVGGVGITKQLYVGGNTTLAGSLATISGLATIANATQATSTTTAALKITNGGLGVGGNGWFGGYINVATTGTFGATVDLSAGNYINFGGNTRIRRNTSTTSFDIETANTVRIQVLDTGELVALSTINSTNTATGALQVRGGVAVGNGLVVGGQATVLGATSLQAATVAGITQFTNITSATSTLTGAVQITGGLGVQGDIYARNIYANGALVGTGSGGSGGSGTSTSTPYINVYTATISLSTLTGGLTVVGGAGIGADMFVGGPIVVNRTFIDSSANIQVGGNTEASGSAVAAGLYAQGGNLLVQSSDYSQANWSKFNATYQAGSTTSPDGTLNGTKLIETGATGGHYFQQTISQTGPVTYSAYLKAAERTFGILNITVGGQAHAAWFNLTTGAAGNTVSGLYPVTSRMETLPYGASSGWYRCSITVWAPTSASATAVGVYTALGNDTGINGSFSAYTGTAGNGMYVFGSQAEPGYYPGAYIATAGSASTPAANIYSGGSLYVASTATVAGSTVTTQATLMTQFGGTTVNGLVINNATNSTSTTTGALQIVNGGIGVGGNVYIGGTLVATAKSFLIDHPTKEDHKLQYGSLEGPENGVYVRGKLEGRVIDLPDYWTALVDPNTITVDLTPIGKFQKLYVEKIEGNKIYVDNSSMFGGPCVCFYTVWAERKDIDKLKVEYKK